MWRLKRLPILRYVAGRGYAGKECIVSDENKAKVRSFLEEAFAKGNVDVVDDVLTPDFVCHDPNSPTGEIRGIELIKSRISRLHDAFTNLDYSIEEQIAEQDKVATRWKFSGTHSGNLFDITPTGKEALITGIQVDRVDGKIIEEWLNYNLLGALQQLGILPPHQSSPYNMRALYASGQIVTPYVRSADDQR